MPPHDNRAFIESPVVVVKDIANSSNSTDDADANVLASTIAATTTATTKVYSYGSLTILNDDSNHDDDDIITKSLLYDDNGYPIMDIRYNDPQRPSNEYVLNVAFYTFFGFCVFQMVFAIWVAHSQSMLADSEAMSTDAMTYLCNLWAERLKKSKLSADEMALPPAVCSYRRHLRRLYLEFIPPMISVMILLIITMFTLRDAIRTLHQIHRVNDNSDNDNDEIASGDDVSISLMLLFSSINLLLDFVNVTCFARSHSLFGVQMFQAENHVIRESIRGHSLAATTALENHGEHHHHHQNCTTCSIVNNNNNEQEIISLLPNNNRDSPTNIFSNLNMCSAWTHVCADTLRSMAVVLAASIATIIPSVNHAAADSIAAIVVSIIIFGSVIPLMQGLILTAIEITSLHQNDPTTTKTNIQATIDV